MNRIHLCYLYFGISLCCVGCDPASSGSVKIADSSVSSESTSSAQSSASTEAVEILTIGGTLNGITGILVLQNNGKDNLTLSQEGAFTFATPLVPTDK